MSSRISRRTALIGIGIVGVGAAAIAARGRGLRARVSNQLEEWQADRTKLPDNPVGALAPGTAAVLSAAAEGLVGLPLERTHYERFYAWRAEHVRGYRAFYEDIARGLNDLSQRSRQSLFAELTVAARLSVAEELAPARSRFGLPSSVVSPAAVRIRRHFIGETLALFNATDAWIVLGYPTWPGRPRGLETYRRPIAGGRVTGL